MVQEIVALNTVANVLGGTNPALTLTLSDHVTGATLATDAITINEAQQTVTAAASSVNEGSSLNFGVSTTGLGTGGLAAGLTESYYLSGNRESGADSRRRPQRHRQP